MITKRTGCFRWPGRVSRQLIEQQRRRRLGLFVRGNSWRRGQPEYQDALKLRKLQKIQELLTDGFPIKRLGSGERE